MESSVGFGDATVYFLHDGGVITNQLNMRVLGIRQEHECGLVERVTIEGFVKREGSTHCSYGATGLMDKAVKVIYNPPATIAIWADGSKTVVKCDEKDVYDPKYGLALCYMKKALGSSRAFNDALRAGMDGWKEYQRKKDVEEKWDSLSDEEKKNLKTVRKMLTCVEPSNYIDSDFLCPINASMCSVCPYKKLPFTECRNKMRLDIERIMDEEKVTKHD